MLLVDKYIPLQDNDIYFNNEIIKMLKVFSHDKLIPHLLFYGVEGVGKKTLIRLLLRMLFDETVDNLKNIEYKIKGSGNKSMSVVIKKSDFHISITPNSNNFDRYIIQNIVKEYAKRTPLEIFKVKKPFKIVVINMIDNLSYYAQTSLRRTMEKYSDNCRFITWCTSLSKVIDPIQSRCLCIRVGLPTKNELIKFVFYVSVNEKLNLSLDEFTSIINQSDGNPKKALWILEYKKQNIEYTEPFKNVILEIVKLLKPSYFNILEIRNKLYNIITTNFNSSEIIKAIVLFFCNSNIKDKQKEEIIEKGIIYESRLNKCRREIIHLEAFIISIIKILN
jgi:replication factor C subunit 3/5